MTKSSLIKNEIAFYKNNEKRWLASNSCFGKNSAGSYGKFHGRHDSIIDDLVQVEKKRFKNYLELTFLATDI